MQEDYLILLNAIYALVVGAIVGAERQKGQKLAGMKTHALVSLGAFTFATIGLILGQGTEGARVVGQVASGIGFLGAGAIMKEGANVKGLTTAATIWCVAALGCLVAVGKPGLAVVGALVVVVSTVLLRKFSQYFFTEDSDQEQ